MDEIAQTLAASLVSALPQKSTSRLLVGICGIPASGKSTLASLVVSHTNTILHSSPSTASTNAVLVGLDSYHLTRAQLSLMPDAQLAHDRRGVHWTFDAHAYVALVQSLRLTPALEVITAPSFDHALKDPTPHAVSIFPSDRIVIIEGLYTFLSIPPWDEAAKLLDERWFVSLDVQEARRRLIKRHVLTGVTQDEAEAEWRADGNDMPNGEFIMKNMLEPTRVIQSVEDPALILL